MARAVNVQVKSRYPKDGLQIIKKFMRMVKDEGILQEYRDRMYYEKPSVVRRKKRARRKRVMEKLKKENN
tara:strand:+ start:193 stop:402 length:210 start_codon:yes stop_codon:yes gene_type:complete